MSAVIPPMLAEAPELAVLEVLDVTLQQTIFALFAVHPELVSADFFENAPHLTAEIWLADIIYAQANNLQHSIDRYRQAVERAQALRTAQQDNFAE